MFSSTKTNYPESTSRFHPHSHSAHVSSLFVSPPTSTHHNFEADIEPLRSPPWMQTHNQQPPSPTSTASRNHGMMSVSALCIPQTSLPPHLAGRALTQSPSSKGSTLSSPPYSPNRPPSPQIEAIHHSMPTPVTPHSPLALLAAESSLLPHQPVPSASTLQINSTSPPPASHRTSSDPSSKGPGSGAEYDERTKTWKNATGFRRDLTAAKLTQPDAPTRRKRTTTAGHKKSTSTGAAVPNLSSTTRVAASSIASLSGGESGGEDDELLDTEVQTYSPHAHFSSMTPPGASASKKRKISATPAPEDPTETEESRLERKRRQNTQAARRSRIRKAEEVQKLQTQIAQLNALLTKTENDLTESRRENGVMRREIDGLKKEVGEHVELGSMLKNAILDMEGVRGEDVVNKVVGRWNLMCKNQRDRDSGMKEETMDDGV